MGIHLPAVLETFWGYTGGMGVQVFFGLSGYLITHLLIRELNLSGRISLRDFYIRRTLRIFPALYVYLAVIGLLTFYGVLQVPLRDFVAAATFTINYVQGDAMGARWFVGHTHSLAIEEQFYLFWPLIFCFCGLARSKKIALALVVMMPLIRVASYFLLPESRTTIGVTMHTCADRLMFGCLLALLEGNPWFERILQRLNSAIFPIFAVVFLLGVQPLLVTHLQGAYVLPLGLSLEGLLIAFIIAWLMRNVSSPASRFLNLRSISAVGVFSYSLYLWQQPFVTELNTTISGKAPWCFVFAIACAVISYFFIEKPVLALRKRFRSNGTKQVGPQNHIPATGR